ncbi:MAG: PilN domain-containing protein [Proteobacteria bacterium]|nr:PilN domain-containing protein [Pseudomonadota bacterium]
MIRINLLPFRAARKKENIRRQITVFGLCIVFLLCVTAYNAIKLNDDLSKLKQDEQRIQEELKTYEDTIKKIADLEKKIKEIRAKLDVIKGLEKDKTGPVRLLDEIATAVPKEKLWLTALKESGGSLRLEGTAMDNETVALFMTNLAIAEHITSVDLLSVRLRYIATYKLRVSDFVLDCKTYAFKPPAPPEVKRRR